MVFPSILLCSVLTCFQQKKMGYVVDLCEYYISHEKKLDNVSKFATAVLSKGNSSFISVPDFELNT